MKKNRMMRLASILLVCVLLSTSVISGTFAKYISTASGSDTARVAKWNIEVEGEKLGVTDKEITFNLFDYTDSNVDVNGLNDNAKVIAPGTTGFFVFDIKNDSEVNAQYTIVLAETNNEGVNHIPLQYKLGEAGEWKDELSDLNADLVEKAIAMNGGTAQQIVYWQWVFDAEVTAGHDGQDNAYDTALGVAANASDIEVTIGAAITVEQVN